MLSVMEQQGRLSARKVNAQPPSLDFDTKVAEATARRDAALSKPAADREVKAQRRGEVVAGVDAALLAIYDRERSQAAPVRPAARPALRWLRHGTRPRFIAKVTASADDEVVRCDECGTILVRTSESGLRAMVNRSRPTDLAGDNDRPLTRLVLLRHGQTALSVERRYPDAAILN